MMSFEPLFKTMKEKGITSYQLQKMGFNRATYHAMKKGKSVSTNTIEHLCKLLQCRVEDIMVYVDDVELVNKLLDEIPDEAFDEVLDKPND